MKKSHLSGLILMVIFLTVLSVYPASGGTQSNIDVDSSYYGPNWDITHDGHDNALDVSRLVSRYGDEDDPDHVEFREDINRDGDVNALDVSALVTYYGQTWTT